MSKLLDERFSLGLINLDQNLFRTEANLRYIILKFIIVWVVAVVVTNYRLFAEVFFFINSFSESINTEINNLLFVSIYITKVEIIKLRL
jgi:hypothetical protein